MSLESKLISLGLTDKEVAVYMAMLYLGPSAAQDIATRAKVNRATTYVMIDQLVDKGMASQITKDKKTLFQAEDPLQILRMLEKEKEEIEEQMGQARIVIPELQELYNLNRSKVSVRLIEGREAARIIQNDLARSKSKSFDNMTNISLGTRLFPQHPNDHRRVYHDKNFKTRSIFTFDPDQPFPPFDFLENETRRLLSQKEFPFFGEFLVYDNKVALINMEDRIFGVIIEDEYIYKSFKTLFELAWQTAEKYTVKEKNEKK